MRVCACACGMCIGALLTAAAAAGAGAAAAVCFACLGVLIVQLGHGPGCVTLSV